MNNSNNIGKIIIKPMDNIKFFSDEQLIRLSELKNFSKEINEMVTPITTMMREIIPQLALNMSEIIKPLTTLTQQITPIAIRASEIMTPIINYLNENEERIENFNVSIQKLEEHYSEIYDTSVDNAITIIDGLIAEGKIIINEDW